MKITITTDDAIRYFGGVTSLSRLLGISRSAIYQWGEFVPTQTAYKIFLMSGLSLGVIDAPEGWPLKQSPINAAGAARNRALLLRAIADGHIAYLTTPKVKGPESGAQDHTARRKKRRPPLAANGD